MNIEDIHDLIHDGAGHLWLIFQINPHHDFNQDTEQKHAPNPKAERKKIEPVG